MTQPGRLERRKARTRAAILEAASRLFHDQGYDDTAIHQIAERADTGVGTLYGYFSSKEEILREVLRVHTANAIQRYRAAVDAATPAADRVSMALEAFADYTRANRPILLAAFQIGAREGRIDDQPVEWLVAACKEMLLLGQEDGSVAPLPVDTAARVLVGTYLMATLGIGIWHGRDPQTRLREDLLVLTQRLIAGGQVTSAVQPLA